MLVWLFVVIVVVFAEQHHARLFFFLIFRLNIIFKPIDFKKKELDLRIINYR